MSRGTCSVCGTGGIVAPCDSCLEPHHIKCLSPDGDDGRLCMGCGIECDSCTSIVLRCRKDSNHTCYMYSDILQRDHGPKVYDFFTGPLLDRIRDKVIRNTGGVSGVHHNMVDIYNLVSGTIESKCGLRLDDTSFFVRMHPDTTDGVDPHIDLDYAVKHMVSPNTCVACYKSIKGNSPLHKTCMKFPKSPTVFTVAVNIGTEPMAFISVGPPCNVSIKKGHLIPIASKEVLSGMKEVILGPGQGILFSAWVIHKSTPTSLHKNRISFDIRGWV